METFPFFRTSPKTPNVIFSKKTGKPLPIVKSVRKKFNIDRTLINLPIKDENGLIINNNRYSNNETNSILVIYEKENFDNKGNEKKPSREFEIISFYDYIFKKRKGINIFNDEKNEIGLKKHVRWLMKGDFIALYESKEDLVSYISNPERIPISKIYKIKGLSSDSRIISGKEYSYGYVNVISNKSIKDEFQISNVKFDFIKVRIDILGAIKVVGEDCF
jgi:hypothetical protein